MLKSQHPALKIAIPLLITVIVIVAGHEIIEAKVFNTIQNQPGVNIHIGSRSGNLLSGYKLRNLTVTHGMSGNSSRPETFHTPSLTVRWSFNPFRLTEISWEPGTYRIESDDGNEEFPVGEGMFTLDESGWLVSENPVAIGESSWNGTMDLKIRADVKQIEGKILIERLPGQLINVLGEAPTGFGVPRYARLELNLEGSPESIKASGTITDPGTRKSFRF